MFPFVILLLVPICIQHLVLGNKKINYEKKNGIALAVFFVIFAVLVMLRHESIGNDTRNYIRTFEKYCDMHWGGIAERTSELGFACFVKTVSLVTKTPQVFLAITALVTMAMIYPTYKRLNADPSLIIVIFSVMSTFVMTFSGIRQMLAVGIGFIAYEFTRRKKLIPFVIAVAIAMTFHVSAFMLAFMYPLYHVKITKKWLLFIVPVLVLMFVFNNQIFAVLGALLEQYTQYDASITRTGAYTMIILFALFAVFAFLIPDEKRINRETIGLRNFLLFALVLQMFAPLHTIAMRMNYYYIIFIPLLLPQVIECRSERWKQVAVLGRHVMVLFFLAYFFVNAYGGGNLNVFPYRFFWEAAA